MSQKSFCRCRGPLMSEIPFTITFKQVDTCYKDTKITCVMHPIPSCAFAQFGSNAKAALNRSKACWVCPAFRYNSPDSVSMRILSGHALETRVPLRKCVIVCSIYILKKKKQIGYRCLFIFKTRQSLIIIPSGVQGHVVSYLAVGNQKLDCTVKFGVNIAQFS